MLSKPVCKKLLKPIGDVDVEECNKLCSSEQKRKCLDKWIAYEKEIERLKVKKH